MGKKSRRKQKARPRHQQEANAGEKIYDYPPDLPFPKGGWAAELRSAKAAYKQERSFDTLLRQLRSHRMMRQWEKLSSAASKFLEGLDKDTSGASKSVAEAKGEVQRYLQEASAVLSIESRITKPFYKERFNEIMTNNTVDDDLFNDGCFQNLNFVQFAALCGDIRLLEKVVSLGAAIDYPTPTQTYYEDSRGELAPPNCTALVLACVVLAVHSQLSGLVPPGSSLNQRLSFEPLGEIVQCAIQLVRLGADCQMKLTIPNTHTGATTGMFRELGLENMTARDLAKMSNHTELIETMEAFSNTANLPMIAHCRCGSRLPWKDCHFSRNSLKSLTRTGEDGRLRFLYAPSAPCWCGTTTKTHYNCCWFSDVPKFQDDKTGKLFSPSRVVPVDNQPMKLLLKLIKMGKAMGLTGPILGNITYEERRAFTLKTIRQTNFLVQLARDFPKSGLEKMDPEVYAGTVERLDEYFLHRADHWILKAAELKIRVSEWNEALNRYCNDMQLYGEERERTIAVHKASTLAPCANPDCNKKEKAVKGFHSCSGCHTVAYCSRSCQRSHRGLHKIVCRG